MKRLMVCGVLLSGLCQRTLWADPQGGQAVAQNILHAAKPIRNHTIWIDTAGNPISCHGGGITRVGDTFYWYGEAFKGNPEGHFGHAVLQHGLKYTDVQNGFNCYSSKNLVDWKYEGACMKFPKDGWLARGTSHRPNVLYNDKTGKYVLWFFCTGTTEPQYPAAMLAVAVADKPTGPFAFVGQRKTGEEHGWGQDLGLFKDQDGKGYLVYDDGHRNIRVDLLADDFQSVSGKTVIAITSDLAKKKRHEGAALIRYQGKYIAAGSGVAGWMPTDTTYAVADAPLGPYKEMGLMSEQRTWNSQISNFVYIAESDKVFGMCDQWFFGAKGQRVPIDESCQLWLPVTFDATRGVAKMQPVEEWNPWQSIANNTGLEFIDTSFENASPLWYEFAADNSIQVHLLYDHERNSPNRAAGHFHFLLHAKPGSKLTLELKNLDNVYDGRLGSLAPGLKLAVVSPDGLAWQPVATELLPDDRVRLTVEMTGPQLYVARVEPYRLSDLDRLLAEIRNSPLVGITSIGRTVQGRELEIVRVGDARAPYRVFIRARAHPWEPGGNWVVEGLIRRLLKDDAAAKKFRRCYCLYTLPMANKDGVARGGTRFNLQGKDLNRDWNQPADPQLAPENHALETWLEGMIGAGQRPHLALDLHNDANGQLHVSNPAAPQFQRYVERMATLERLLRKHSWFTEGSTRPTTHLSGTLADGWLERFGIDAAIHEFNANWIAGLKAYPSGRHWQDYGERLADVFYDYFESVKP